MKSLITDLVLVFIISLIFLSPLFFPEIVKIYRENVLLKSIKNNSEWVDRTSEKCIPSDSFVLTINAERE